MNFDELKSKWDNEKSDNLRIPQDMKMLKMAQHPLDKLKRNMRNELYAQVVAILFLAFLPYIFQLQSNHHLLYYIIYTILVVISSYYLYNFYRFYKSMHLYTSATKGGLLELYYELRLNMERYKSFSFSLQPFTITFLGLYFYSRSLASGENMEFFIEQNLLLMMIFIAVLTAGIMLISTWWVNSFYGKYTKQIRKILDELAEE